MSAVQATRPHSTATARRPRPGALPDLHQTEVARILAAAVAAPMTEAELRENDRYENTAHTLWGAW
ncbi:hypothetical protein [Azorhizobium doebereinerae]|uniref:hypothetical protein n=1 Tax=Azorhizobium doebereinerae TaxID=281091 RepID=UPI00041F1E0E|nr:hypothetical protein [Azorhizobium doebereinerae]